MPKAWRLSLPGEKWKNVVGYAGKYEISSLGRIWTNRQNRLMHQSLSRGYPVIRLSRNRSSELLFVHHVVARAFIGRRPEGSQVDHVNAVKNDNRPENLEYVTPQENDRRATAMGLKASGDRNGTRTMPWRKHQGESHYGAKLSTKQVKTIRSLRDKARQADIARRFGVCQSHISNIINNHARKSEL